MAKEWKNVSKTSDGQEYVEPCVLGSGPRSVCKAVFFRNCHKSSGEQIVSLKIARQKKVANQWITKEDKSLTLKPEEINKLIEYIQEYYAPLNIGMTEFIEADKDAAKLFTKVRDLGISDDEVVSKLIESGILTQNLAVAITAAERNDAVREFEQAIDVERTESFWQNWFAQYKWVLGSEYLRQYRTEKKSQILPNVI